MKTAAVICEYNPFHSGHLHQLSEAKKRLDCDAVIGMMSGNYVQRGDVAVYPKQIRAKAALYGGIDLVLELPAALTLQSAERYAANAVGTLNALGCVDYLFFGAECPETDLLMNIANVLAYEDSDFKLALRRELDRGLSFAAARSNAVKEIIGGASAEILSTPNNILAVEYCKALIRSGSTIKPYAIARKGVNHDAGGSNNGFASASEIRRRILCGEDISKFVPEFAADIYSGVKPSFIADMECSLAAALCMTSADKLSQAPDVSEGLENAILRAAFEADTLDGIIAGVKSKRYAYSRIRRIILCSYLGITKADSALTPQYIRILDFNERGREILSSARSTAALPLAKNGRQIKDNPKALELWKRELILDRIYDIFRH